MEFTKDFNYIGKITKADISLQSQKIYLERIKTLTTKLEQPLYWILKNPKESLDFIFKLSESENTRKSYVSAILAVFKHNTGLKEASGFSSVYKTWLDKFKELDESIEERYKLNKPSDKQQEGYVPYKDIVKKRDELENTDMDKLLLGMYTYIKPLRADFNAVSIYKKLPTNLSKHENYIDMSKKQLILQEYKTQKDHNKLEIDLPAELIKLINESLKEKPREYLFTDKKGDAYSANSYIKYANRRFLSLFKKPLTITLIRHSYISSLDQNKLTTKEKEEIALAMGHTKGMQELYRFV